MLGQGRGNERFNLLTSSCQPSTSGLWQVNQPTNQVQLIQHEGLGVEGKTHSEGFQPGGKDQEAGEKNASDDREDLNLTNSQASSWLRSVQRGQCNENW